MSGTPRAQPDTTPSAPARRAAGSTAAHAARRPARLRRRDALHHHSLHFGPNMTPMVDVVMVILVFFMASAAFLGPEWFLPSLIAQPPAPASPASKAATSTDPFALAPVQKVITLTRRGAASPAGPSPPFSSSTAASAGGASVLASIDGAPAVPAAEALQSITALVAGPGGSAAAEKLEILLRPAGNVAWRDVIAFREGLKRGGVTRVGMGPAAADRAPAGAPDLDLPRR